MQQDESANVSEQRRSWRAQQQAQGNPSDYAAYRQHVMSTGGADPGESQPADWEEGEQTPLAAQTPMQGGESVTPQQAEQEGTQPGTSSGEARGVSEEQASDATNPPV